MEEMPTKVTHRKVALKTHGEEDTFFTGQPFSEYLLLALISYYYFTFFYYLYYSVHTSTSSILRKIYMKIFLSPNY